MLVSFKGLPSMLKFFEMPLCRASGGFSRTLVSPFPVMARNHLSEVVRCWEGSGQKQRDAPGENVPAC
jgi:hypothetical protein